MGLTRRKVWEANSPETLVQTTTRFCLSNLSMFTKREETGLLHLKDDIYLPAELCENFIHVAKEDGINISDEFLNIFQPGQTKLRSLFLENSPVSDEGLKMLLSQELRELEIKQCKYLTVNSLHNLNKYSERLERLELGTEVYILPDYLQPQGTFSDSESEDERDGNIFEKQGYILQAPNLQSLIIRDLFVRKGSSYFDLLLKPLSGLLRLDVPGLNHNFGIKCFDWLLNCKLLVSLNLHNVKNLQSSLHCLTQLTRLQHLDVSQCKDSRGQFKEPVVFLKTLVESLPQLTSLDISGTNLSSLTTHPVPGKLCDIAGLVSRVDKPLNFLGLYKTLDDASSRLHIPARSITGDHSEEQILLAGQLYLDRASVLENILNDLFQMFRSETCQNLKLALEVLLMAMERHNKEKHIQISGSASLYYVVKSESIKPDLNVKVKRKILSILLNGMLTHKTDPTMMRNGCLTLCHFTMPQDVLFDYERLVCILLHIVSDHHIYHYIYIILFIILFIILIQVEGEQKKLVGGLGAIEKMLQIIKDKLSAGLCDDVMETAWSTMWNVTDETPFNCKRFLDGDGMNLFLKCKERFPDKQDLLRNMMGLLGNVAEVPHLRKYLMTSEFVEEFSFLMDSSSDGIEVSYNAAGVLAHMASDGPDAWTIQEPERDFVLARMVRAINRWQIDSARNINYRSFEPIIRLLPIFHTPECQLWAVWAIANLTKVSPEKYCGLVVSEGGLQVIEEIINSNTGDVATTRPDVLNFANQVRFNVLQWRENGQRLDFDG
ncbi:protein zer-1 homolog [Eurytemora carolleeae]|uniref:protein zer-1 homolog n=1 Tax=Eurytemora carolleeae TaxID=1294199 RepID=UPI000C76C917|nr:protein zer-1 homolog [Eurytemora carolleeae]|eukprot:XP_023341040.1 protein zer-1 homolog [Eurytemora affinis]